MGLDIHLLDQDRRDYENAFDRQWKDFYERTAGMTEQQRDVEAAKMPPYGPRPETYSRAHPDFWMGPRYLRSSYNGGGFNHAAPEILSIPEDEGSFYWIFAPVHEVDAYDTTLTAEHLESLATCRDRARDIAARLRACERPVRALETTTLLGASEHQWHTPPTAEEVLAWYREKSAPPAGESYGSAQGDRFGTPLEVVPPAVGKDILVQTAAILVYRMPASGVEEYAKAADCAAEMAEDAIELINR